MRINLTELQEPKAPQPLAYAEVTAHKGQVYLRFFSPRGEGGDYCQYGILIDRQYARALGFALCDEYLRAMTQDGVEVCGKVSNGVACTSPKGSGCPDCTVSLHDVGAPE